MKLGLIARADNSGLGIQTWEFYNAMLPYKTLVVDLSGHNNNSQYPERYPRNAVFTRGVPTIGDIHEFLEGLDCVFVAEAPYNYYLYERAKEMGVKTAVQYNYEFLDWLSEAYSHFPTPDMLIAPSRWNFDVVDKWAKPKGIKHVYLHCPVNRLKLPFQKRTAYKTFLHIVGRAAAHDRNGTMSVIEAAPLLQSDANILMHFQGEQGLGHQVTHNLNDYIAAIRSNNAKANILVRHKEFDNYQDVYSEGDILLLPRRYGGNCLPMNEALSVGMPVLMPDISPNDSFLDKTWLMPAEKVGEFKPRTTIDIYEVNPQTLANKIDEFAGMLPDQAGAHSEIANALAEKIDWENMRSEYMQVLEDLCRSQ